MRLIKDPHLYKVVKMAAGYIVGFLCALGFVQGSVVHRGEPAFIEQLRSASNSRIVGGWEAEPGQIPHQVSLRMVSSIGQVSSCGGSIIHHEWVITAAHCLRGRHTFVVRIGSTNLTRPEHVVETQSQFIHPYYNELSPVVQAHDIALLGLNTWIPYGPLVQPCRLQQSASRVEEYVGTRLTVSGYGRTDDPINGGAAVEHLRWVFLRGISLAECRSWYPNSLAVVESTVCAEYYNHTSQSSCQGDSGGPLTLVDLDGKPTMVGVVSFGSSAGCNSAWPSAYVRPEFYHDWYTETTGINFDWNRDDLIEESSSDDSNSNVDEDDSNKSWIKENMPIIDA